MNWKFWKNEEPVEPDVTKYYLIPNCDLEYYSEHVEEWKQYLKQLTRIQLMEVEDMLNDADGYDNLFDYLLEEIFDRYWMGQDLLDQVDDKILYGDDALVKQFPKLKAQYAELDKQVQGMQKKLDKIQKLLEEAEFTMSGKTAMNL
jgi:uncharacterized protein YhaN